MNSEDRDMKVFKARDNSRGDRDYLPIRLVYDLLHRRKLAPSTEQRLKDYANNNPESDLVLRALKYPIARLDREYTDVIFFHEKDFESVHAWLKKISASLLISSSLFLAATEGARQLLVGMHTGQVHEPVFNLFLLILGGSSVLVPWKAIKEHINHFVKLPRLTLALRTVLLGESKNALFSKTDIGWFSEFLDELEKILALEKKNHVAIDRNEIYLRLCEAVFEHAIEHTDRKKISEVIKKAETKQDQTRQLFYMNEIMILLKQLDPDILSSIIQSQCKAEVLRLISANSRGLLGYDINNWLQKYVGAR